MNLDKKKIHLKDSDIALDFTVSLSRNSDEVTVSYKNYEEERFSNFHRFLHALSLNYRNQIKVSDSIAEQINICNDFIVETNRYKAGSFSKLVKDEEIFFKEIGIQQGYFLSYKQKIIEQKDLNKSGAEFKEKEYSLKQQVLILDYLGCIEQIRRLNMNETILGEIVSVIIGKDKTNTLRALRYMNKVVEKGNDHTKTRSNLEVVKQFFHKNNLSEIENRIQEELNTLKKG